MIQRVNPLTMIRADGEPSVLSLPVSDRWARPARFAAARDLVARSKLREAGGAAAGGAPASKLVEATLDPQVADVIDGPALAGELACKVTEYPDGVRAVVYTVPRHWRSPSDAANAAASSRASREEPTDQESFERSASSISRSRATVVHRARCMNVHSMWTFSKRGKFGSPEAVWSAWRKFSQSMSRRWKKEWKYVAVPELHGDGETWHLHVLFSRYYQVETLRRYWYRALGGKGDETGADTPGAVNVKTLRHRNSNGRAAARYVAKYVGKGFERGRSHARLFACSAGLDPVGVRQWRDGWSGHLTQFAESVGRRLCADYGFQEVYPRVVWRDSFGFAVIDVAARVDGRGHLH